MIAKTSHIYIITIILSLYSYMYAANQMETPKEVCTTTTESLERQLFEDKEMSPLCYVLPATNIAETLVFEEKVTQKRSGKNHCLVMVYMAADNDLKVFASRNIRQMAAIGSNNPFLTIVVHLDIRLNNNYKVTRRYLIEKGKITHINAHDATTQRMDSGDPQTLISFCQSNIAQFPADNHVLILWNHGTGYLDPEKGRIIDPSIFFVLNPKTQRWELDRSLAYIDFIEQNYDARGVCWDDTTGNYLNNQKLVYALDTICQTALGGKKFDIIGFDACLMSMVEMAHLIKPYATIMVASQEVELGAGWNYSLFLEPLAQKKLSREDLAETIVHAYKQTYATVTEDYTLSAINLELLDPIETHLNNVAKHLKECISQQLYKSVTNSIKASRNKVLCTHFEEPSYIDLHHWVTNLLSNVQHFTLKQSQENSSLIANLRTELNALKNAIEKAVFASCSGPKLSKARGLSIYFPEQFIFKSYPTSIFAQKNEWYSFLSLFLRS